LWDSYFLGKRRRVRYRSHEIVLFFTRAWHTWLPNL
jgi:hypothetical protein